MTQVMPSGIKIILVTDFPLMKNGQPEFELFRQLTESGINRNEVLITSVFSSRFPANRASSAFATVSASNNSLAFHGLYPSAARKGEILQLYTKIKEINPKLIIAMGQYALWALTSEARIVKDDEEKDILVPTGLGDFRGSMLWTRDGIFDARIPVLPIFHPETIIKSWENRAPTIHDLKTRVPKALQNNWSPKVKPFITIYYDFDQLTLYLKNLLYQLDAGRKIPFANDIETRNYIITCMGFATGRNHAFVIPFVKKDPAFGLVSHWTVQQEVTITRLLMRLLAHPNASFIGQNYSYDMTYIHRYYGVIPNVHHDTLTAQHLLFPGTQKDLGYLSSIYCEYHRYWKDDNKEWDTKSSLVEHFTYNGEDCLRTFEIHSNQLMVISQQKIEHLWAKELLKQREAFKQSVRGVLINLNKKAELAFELGYASKERVDYLLKLVPQSSIEGVTGKVSYSAKSGKKQQVFWPNSSAQQKVLFYEILGMDGQRHRKTRQLTLDKEAIPKLKKKYPIYSRIFDALLELRSIDVFASTFVNARVDADRRMRTNFNTAGTETFRWSSSKNAFDTGCNFQNLPSGKEM